MALSKTDADVESGALESANLPRLVHELKMHQIELEMQNQALRGAQAELEAERANYFDLYNLAPVGYCSLNVQGLIVQANLTVAALLGIGRHGLIGRPLAGLVDPRDASRYAQYRDQLSDSGRRQCCELRLLKQGAAPIWAQLAASVVHADGAAVVRVVLSDISERKQAEDALQQQSEFFELIAENIGDFIAVLDRDGRRLYNSPSYMNFFGGARDLRGTDSFAEIHPDDRPRVAHVFRETVRTGQGRQIDYRLLIADGSVRDLESRGSVIKDKDGQVLRVVVVAHDITERKRLEKKVLQLAFHDALTDLPNRRLFNDRLSQTLAASARSACHGAVMFLDLDNFKRINDWYGHAVGDLLLIEAAERLRCCVREMDTVARFGGDEFVVMISELALDRAESTAQAGAIAEKIRAALAQPYLLTIKDEAAGHTNVTVEHQCSASIGVVLFVDHVATQGDILKWADRAMYQAKAAGRNAIRFFEPSVPVTPAVDSGGLS